MLLDLEKYFKEMLGSTGDFRKGIAHINYIKKKYGIKATQIMFVGDERADMRLAGRLGVMCVGVVNNKEKNELKDEFGDYVIQELSSIVEILQRV
jgi:phosphoglycolate phosphatase-like HAD superfamily hydrolase